MKLLLLTLHIVVYNYDTGDKLYEVNKQSQYPSVQSCYKEGIDYILPIMNGIRTYIPNASANVSCDDDVL